MFNTGSFMNARALLYTDGKFNRKSTRAVFEYLASENIATLSFDVMGHGDSDPLPPFPRHAIKRFSNVANDALLHLKEVVLPFCQANCSGAPVFLMGSSMGALASVILAAMPEVKAMPTIKGLIMNAAAIDATRTWVTTIQEPLAGFANLLIPMWGIIPPTDPKKYHRDPAELEKRAADTRLDKGAIKVCTACAMLEGFEIAQEIPKEILMPILALHGEKDQVCPLGKVEDFLSRVNSNEVILKKYPEGLHDMLHDYEKNEVRKEIVTFIKSKLD